MQPVHQPSTGQSSVLRFPTGASWAQPAHPWLRLENGRTRLTLLSVLLVLAVLGSATWYAAPYVARDYINRSLSGLPDYTGRVESVRIHPWSASLDLYDVHLDKRSGAIPVHFFYSPRWLISLQWSEIFRGVQRASVTVFDPQINLVSGPNSQESQFYLSDLWLDAIKKLVPWRINQVRIHRGDVHFLDFHASPPIDLEADQLEIDAENMSNSQGLKIPLPASITVTARPLLSGTFAMKMAINLDEQFATFTQNFTMQHVPAVGANAFLQKYLKVRVKSGEIGLYSELASDKGIYHGYAKPFFYHLEFEPKASDEGNLGADWSGILNVAKGLFENDQGTIATQCEISGRLDQPHVDVTSAFAGVLCNAYINALRPGFDPTHMPSQPTDTMTTSLSPITEKETALPSSTAKNQPPLNP